MQWRSITRQLLVQGYLMMNDDRFGALQLTDKSRSLLKGEIKLYLREDLLRDEPSNRSSSRGRTVPSSPQNKVLWEALREARQQIAQANGIPAYQVFHDATLMDMIERRPQTKQAMLNVNGVGQHKLELYADAFLAVLTAPDH